MHNKLSGIYAISDTILTPDTQIISQAKEAVLAGVQIFQYRNKEKSDKEVEYICRELQALCRVYGTLFIIDDRPHLAQKIGADGVHIGKDDMPLSKVKKIFPHGIIGVSCYGSVTKAKEAEKEGASYVAFGSFFNSPTKPHSGIVPLHVLEKAKEQLTIPICAIGGINLSNINEVARKNPDMICAVSALFNGNITKNIIALTKAMR